MRLEEAKLRYHNDTDLMLIYAQKHHKKAQEVDEGIQKMIHETSNNPKIRDKLLTDWRHDTLHEEKVSHQVWIRHEQFLRRKKRDDEVKKCTLLTPFTWEEQLRNRRPKTLKSPVPVNL